MNKQLILNDFEKTFSSLEDSIALYEAKSFNQIPFEGSWTPGQVVQHIILASSNFPHILAGEIKETDRPIDQLVATLKSIFLNYQTKMKSPDFILPELKDYDREAFLTKVQQIKQDISQTIASLPLDKTCLGFQFPTLGHLTRLEAVYFVIYHTQRHVHQLQEIHRFLKLA